MMGSLTVCLVSVLFCTFFFSIVTMHSIASTNHESGYENNTEARCDKTRNLEISPHLSRPNPCISSLGDCDLLVFVLQNSQYLKHHISKGLSAFR
jgi:hypothetical protein